MSSPLSQSGISLTASSSNRSSALTWTPAALFCHSISTLTLTAIHIRNLNKAHSAGEIRSLHSSFECYFVLKQMHICMFYCCCRLSFSVTSLVFRFSISAMLDRVCGTLPLFCVSFPSIFLTVAGPLLRIYHPVCGPGLGCYYRPHCRFPGEPESMDPHWPHDAMVGD